MSRRRPGSRLHRALDQRRWQHVRRQALDLAGWRCAKCGKVSVFEVDHVVPLHRGGSPYELSNLQVLCKRPCHLEKTLAEAGRVLLPERAAWRGFVEELMANAVS